MSEYPRNAVQCLKAVRAACPGMGLLLAKQLLILHEWSIIDAIDHAQVKFNGDWPVGIHLPS